MGWVKQGPIFAPDGGSEWMASHATLPVVDPVGDRLRVYFGTRDRQGRSHTTYLEVDAADPGRVLYVHDRPILPLGPPGTFDDNGIMPSWLVTDGPRKLLYYIGWNPQVTVPYRVSIGLAVSDDGGRYFHKASAGPIRDRGIDEPYFCTTPCVLRAGGGWRMWYASCTGWESIDGRPEPRYHVKSADSADGVRWDGPGRVCVDYDRPDEAIGRPCVVPDAGRYRMYYSTRSVQGYRHNPAAAYRLGYAESDDGLSWTRQDDRVGIARSDAGWDAAMLEYCYHLWHGGREHLFYNGNGFGQTGIGYAVRADEDRTRKDRISGGKGVA